MRNLNVLKLSQHSVVDYLTLNSNQITINGNEGEKVCVKSLPKIRCLVTLNCLMNIY